MKSARRTVAVLIGLALAITVVTGLLRHHQVRHVAPFTTGPGALVAFSEYQLSNGLVVILAPNDSSRSVSVSVTYDAGSRYETPGKTGLAHMCEHMMFKGSANVAAGEYADLVESAGGYHNAGTTRDWTNFYETLPASQLPLALFLESDRMRGLVVTDEHVEQVRQEVKDEKSVRHDDIAYDPADEACNTVAYSDFGYSHPPAGLDPDLNAITRDDVDRFVKDHYAPNRAAICVCGRFDPATARTEIARYFGNIRRGEDPPSDPSSEFGLTTGSRERRTYLHDDFATYQYYARVYAVAPNSAADYAALRVLDTMLSGSANSRLHRSIVEGLHAVDASSTISGRTGKSLFTISVKYIAGIAAIKQALDDELTEIQQGRISDEEVEASKRRVEVQSLGDLDSALSTSRALSEAAIGQGDPNRVNELFTQVRGVTPYDIRRVALKYFGPDQMCEVSSGKAPATPNLVEWIASLFSRAPAAPAPPPPAKRELEKNAAPVTPLEAAAIPAVTTFKLSNGLTASVCENNRLPYVVADIDVRAGDNDDSRPGIARLTSETIVDGTVAHPARQFQQTLDDDGIQVSKAVYPDYVDYTFEAQSSDAPAMLSLINEMLRTATFNPERFEQERQEDVDNHAETDRHAGVVLHNIEFQCLAGGTPFARRWPNANDLGVVTREAVVDFYHRCYVPNRTVIAIAGDLPLHKAKPLIAQIFGNWKQSGAVPAPAVPSRQTGASTFVVDWPYNKDSYITLSCQVPVPFDRDRAAFEVLDEILAAGPASRLHHRLRDEGALTYSASSVIDDYRGWSMWKFTTNCQSADASKFYADVHAELDRIRLERVSDQELASAKRALAGSVTCSMDALDSLSGGLADALSTSRPFDSAARDALAVQKVTSYDVLRVAQLYLDDGHLCVVGVGPKVDLGPAFGRFGYVDALDEVGRPYLN